MEKACNTVVVKKYIRDYIAKNKLQPGDLLPSEGQIADELGIGRNSVREATRALDSIGLIEIKKGKEWVPIHEGEMLCDENIESFMGYGFGTIQLSKPVQAKQVRLNIQSSNGLPVIYSIRLKNVQE